MCMSLSSSVPLYYLILVCIFPHLYSCIIPEGLCPSQLYMHIWFNYLMLVSIRLYTSLNCCIISCGHVFVLTCISTNILYHVIKYLSFISTPVISHVSLYTSLSVSLLLYYLKWECIPHNIYLYLYLMSASTCPNLFTAVLSHMGLYPCLSIYGCIVPCQSVSGFNYIWL